MTFTYKLAQRLARLKHRTAIAAAIAVATIFSCELPVRSTGAGSTITQLVVAPKNVTLQPSQAYDFVAVGFTATGDSADASVSWSASNGNVTASTSGKRHYGHYQNATCGTHKVVATGQPGNLSDTANVTVTGCTVPVATVTVSPGSATVLAGQAVQLTATLMDANGSPLSGRVVTWASSNTALAVVDANGNVTGMSPGSATITATSEGKNGTAAITVTNIPVASVTVSPSPAGVQQGSTVQLTATPKDANGTPLTGRVVTWASNNTTVATVNGSGLVTGRAAGSATITATSEGQSGTSGVTVTLAPVASVTVSPSPASVPVGLTVQLTATPKDANGNPLSGRVITWSSDNASVATVNGSGLVTAAALGSATITATSEGRSGTSAITVTDVPVASVTVTPSPASVQAGQTVQLTATPKDANGTPLAGRVVTWSSNTTTVATVNGSGLVSGVAAGSAMITATSEGKSGTSAITVAAIPVASVTVSPSPASVVVGQTVQLTATPKDANGNPLSGRVVTWSSNNTTVATVNTSGRVTGRAAGTATITATSEGQSGTSDVTVTLAPVASVMVSPSPTSVQVGQTVQLTATPKDASGNPLSGRVVTWASNNTAVATVNGSGLVTGVAAGGPVTITATSEGQSGTSAISVTPPSASVVLVGAGDIADCNTGGPTAALLDNIAGTVFTAGDNAYPNGSASDFANCYDPSWGRHKARTRPSPGNHDYGTSGATGYYNYFGALAGPAGLGYYSYDLGAWHIVSLNSNISMSAGSAQETWLRGDLASSTKTCTIAYWHHPRFSSGSTHGSSTQSAGVFQALYDAGAEIVIVGHDHEYERFAPQTPTAAADPARGIREFVVGTGGTGLYSFGTPVANSEVRDNASHGVLKLTLSDGSYTWQFIPVAGDSFTDSGSGTCH